MTADIIDVRPDRFLREIREGKGLEAAAAIAGLDLQELEDIIRGNARFELATRECYLEYIEDLMRANAMRIVTGAKEFARLVEEEVTALLEKQLQELRNG